MALLLTPSFYFWFSPSPTSLSVLRFQVFMISYILRPTSQPLSTPQPALPILTVSLPPLDPIGPHVPDSPSNAAQPPGHSCPCPTCYAYCFAPPGRCHIDVAMGTLFSQRLLCARCFLGALLTDSHLSYTLCCGCGCLGNLHSTEELLRPREVKGLVKPYNLPVGDG